MDGRAGQGLAGALILFSVQPPFERHRLLAMKLLEVLVSGCIFKAGKRLGDWVDRLVIPPPGFLEVVEVFAFDPGV